TSAAGLLKRLNTSPMNVQNVAEITKVEKNHGIDPTHSVTRFISVPGAHADACSVEFPTLKGKVFSAEENTTVSLPFRLDTANCSTKTNFTVGVSKNKHLSYSLPASSLERELQEQNISMCLSGRRRVVSLSENCGSD
ncbi:hypothetical protein BaRGS_00018462, partial [Batillaria attramentaria]